jgi:hypothetical protein
MTGIWATILWREGLILWTHVPPLTDDSQIGANLGSCAGERFEYKNRISPRNGTYGRVSRGSSVHVRPAPKGQPSSSGTLKVRYTGYSVTPKTVKYGAGFTARNPSGPATPKTRMRTISKPMFP